MHRDYLVFRPLGGSRIEANLTHFMPKRRGPYRAQHHELAALDEAVSMKTPNVKGPVGGTLVAFQNESRMTEEEVPWRRAATILAMSSKRAMSAQR